MIVSIRVSCKPQESTLVPHSTGHLLYSGLLESIKEHNPELSEFIHQNQKSNISLSPLKGEFKSVDRNRKRVFENAEYRFYFNLLNAEEAYKPLFREFVLEDEEIQVGDAILELREMKSNEVDIEDLMLEEPPQKLKFHFTSPVSVDYRGSGVTEMFPHREAVFKSLEKSWNSQAPDELSMDLDTEEIKRSLTEQPKADTYDTHNVIVSRKGHPDENYKIPIKAFGFTGKVDYGFKNAEEELRHRIGILSRWANYAGIGSHTARGCGSVDVEVVSNE